MKVLIFLVSLIIFLGTLGTDLVWYVQFDRGCEGYLKRAADANTIVIAKEQLGTALKYIRENKLTSGYTSVFYNTPDEDIGFWYNNLQASYDELEKASQNKEMSQLEQSNVLMKLRETLIDHSKDGTSVTCPSGITRYPYNGLMGWIAILSFIFGVISLAIIIGDD